MRVADLSLDFAHAAFEAEMGRIDPALAGAEPSLIMTVMRLMRGRWSLLFALCAALGAASATAGFFAGSKSFESQAILRVYPKAQSVLYATSEDSVIKTYDSFVRAETSFVASTPVMGRALKTLLANHPDGLFDEISVADLKSEIKIKRSESLIVLTTKSQSPGLAAAKLEAVTSAYLALTDETKSHHMQTRTAELKMREAMLTARLEEINAALLRVGAEFGPDAMAKAHIEKISKIAALENRVGEVQSTLESLKTLNGEASADMNDQRIVRATLLDRGLADINIERARQKAELAALRQRYTDGSPKVRNVLGKIAILDKAMEDRRRQIQVLGQTGALTEQGAGDNVQSVADIGALLAKVTARLEKARTEARDLNARRIKLAHLTAEQNEIRRMLDDTRAALDKIALESDNALPGLVELMVPAAPPEKAAKDTSKLFAAAGLVAGSGFGAMLVIGIALTNRRLRFSDDIWRILCAVPLLGAIIPGEMRDVALYRIAVDRIRNRIMLTPARSGQAPGAPRTIAIGRVGKGGTVELAAAMADSFARSRMNTLLVDAEATNGALTVALGGANSVGWSHVLEGVEPSPETFDAFDLLPVGATGADGLASTASVRAAVKRISKGYDVVLVNIGDLDSSISAELLLSSSDFAVGVIRAGDLVDRVRRWADRLDHLPANGGGFVMENVRPSDPGAV